MKTINICKINENLVSFYVNVKIDENYKYIGKFSRQCKNKWKLKILVSFYVNVKIDEK